MNYVGQTASEQANLIKWHYMSTKTDGKTEHKKKFIRSLIKSDDVRIKDIGLLEAEVLFMLIDELESKNE